MNTLNNWAPAAIIVFGYLVGILYQTHYIDKRFEDLYRYLDAKFSEIDRRFTEVGVKP